MSILNEMAPDKKDRGSVTDGDLDGAKQSLDKSALMLLLQELEYDEKCMTAYVSKTDSYQIRLSHQKNEWIQKQMERAKTSVYKWFDAKVGKLKTCVSILACPIEPRSWSHGHLPEQVTSHCWPEKIDGATAINVMQQVEESAKIWMQSLQLRTPVTHHH